jgi:hypothetical protein
MIKAFSLQTTPLFSIRHSKISQTSTDEMAVRNQFFGSLAPLNLDESGR